jgi:hypothetical protein
MPRAKDKEKLQERRRITITIDATEQNLQRLTALLLFADKFEEEPVKDLGPLPFDEPAKPARELQLDYGVIRSGIIKRLSEYVKRHSTEEAKALIRSFGAETINAIAKEQLVGLYDALDQ